MQALDIRREPALDVTVRAQLDRVIADLERQFPQLPAPVVLPWSDRPVVGLDRGTPWLWGEAARVEQDGVAVIPRRQRRQLERIAASGTRFDAVAVAHELDAAGPVRPLLPQLADGPRTCTDEIAKILVPSVPPHPGVARAAGMLDALVGGDALAWAAGALDRLLDPIVFGVVAPYGLVHGVPAVLQPLIAWTW
jgi:hypothetical protein